jgi:hypothetical protein
MMQEWLDFSCDGDAKFNFFRLVSQPGWPISNGKNGFELFLS